MSDAVKPGAVEMEIRKRIDSVFGPVHLELDNESRMHNVPPGSETHFRVVVVSSKFEGLSRIARQRLVNETLADLIAPGGIHALTQKTLTPEEWQKAGGADGFVSPACLGGSKADRRD
jgi:stress-induced morphogen